MRYLWLFLLSFAFLAGTAQEYYDRDSLWRQYAISSPDTSRVLLLIQLGQQYENNNPDSALLLYEEALRLSQNLNYTQGIVRYYTNATYVYNLLGRYDTSLVLNLRSVEIAREMGDRERLAACLANVGSSYLYLKDYEQSVKYTLDAMELLQELMDYTKLALLSSNLSIVFRETGQLDKAYRYGKEGVHYARLSDNPIHITVSLNNMGPIYLDRNQPDSAIIVLKEAISLALTTNNIWARINANLNLVEAYGDKHQYPQMKASLDEVLQLVQEVDDKESIAIAYRGYSYYYLKTGDPGKARQSINESLAISEANGYKYHVQRAYLQLANIALVEHDFASSEFYSAKADSLQQVILNEEVAANVEGVQLRYDSRRQQREIENLEQRADLNQKFMIALSVGFVMMLVVVGLTYRTFQQRGKIHQRDALLQQSRIEQLEKEKQLMASEYLIKAQEEERTRMAKDLHDGLGGMLSGVKFSLTNMRSNAILDADSLLVFDRSLDMLDHSIKELRRVAHNMMPEVLVNFGLPEAVKNLCDQVQQTHMLTIDFQSIGFEHRLPKETEIHAYRIIQELLSNVLKHAKATQMVVQLSVHDKELLITIEDNGVGFDPSAVKDPNSAGLSNIRNRLNYLNGRINIHTGREGGTSVEISIQVP